MATACCTSGWRGQKINACCISALQGNYSHWIRRKTAAPEAIFFIFLFHFSPFHLFTTNVTQALPLETIKGEAGAAPQKRKHNDECRNEHTDRQTHVHLTKTTTHTYHPSKETSDLLLFSKACNPYYEHSGARQHEHQQNSLDIESFLFELVYTLVSALHTIRA
jgi:hypothetical protein